MEYTKEQLQEAIKKCPNYRPRLGLIKTSNFECYVDDDGHLYSTSYSWWAIVDYKQGLYFFNDYSYSQQTRQHQYQMHNIMKQLDLGYITVKYSGQRYNGGDGTLQNVSIGQILTDKINSLYSGENALALSRATKHAVYTGSEFNQTMKDIRKIAAALKMSEKELNNRLIEAETKASEAMLTKLCDDYTRQTTIREMRKANNNLDAIEL
jgi:hypothetical protein